MAVIKSTLTVQNKTHYLDETRTKMYNSFVSPQTYYYETSKITGYETRLFYEFKYCQENDGQVFFYTLTYNDKNLPKYLGRNCFDYNDLRDLLNGAFTKYLLRHYGIKYRYFVGAELGDGKGSRGWHNNPHYHLMLFCRSAQDSDYPYQKITEKEMTSLLRLYWQGEDNTDWVHRGQFYKKGIVDDSRPGLGPVVKDFKALNYSSKYVVKDINLVMMETKIREHFTCEFVKTICEEEESYKRFWFDHIVSVYNPGNRWTDQELFKMIVGHSPYKKDYGYLAGKVIEHLGIIVLYKDFCRTLVNEKVEDKIKEYRNRYCNKCRCSKGLGEYGLNFIEDDLNPSLLVDGAEGIKNRSIGQYYYRKKYCDVVKDDAGQNVYVLNQLGIDYKCHRLPGQINDYVDRTLQNLSKCPDEESYNTIINSDVNKLGGYQRVYLSYSEFKDFINTDIKEKIRKYAEYKLVYEGRFFKVQDDGPAPLNWMDDYRYFITPVIGLVDYRTSPVSDFLQNTCEGYLAYHSHSYFLSDSWIYPVFDLLADYYFIQEDNKKREEAEERKKIRRFHIGRKLNNKYGYIQ